MSNPKIKGFTLLELIVASLILTIVSTTLLHFFGTGKKVYKVLSSESTDSGKLFNTFYFFQKDIQYLYLSKYHKIYSDQNRIYFYKNTSQSGPSRVDYMKNQHYEGNDLFFKLNRLVTPFGKKEPNTYKIKNSPTIITHTKKIDLFYLAKVKEKNKTTDEEKEESFKEENSDIEKSYDKQTKEKFFKWFNSWPHKEPPIAIKIVIEIGLKKTERIFWIPE